MFGLQLTYWTGSERLTAGKLRFIGGHGGPGQETSIGGMANMQWSATAVLLVFSDFEETEQDNGSVTHRDTHHERV